MTKVDIYSGFLGAGKTTLIKKMIAEAYAGEKIVLIENEFGEIGVDGGFLADAGVEVTEMNSGCICCSLVGDFAKALSKVAADFAPDRILIEPSGVGKLSDVAKAVRDVPGMEVNALIAVADAKKCRMYMRNFGEFFNDQIQHAGAIVLSRTQEMEEAKLHAAEDAIRSLNPKAALVTTEWSALNGGELLAVLEGRDTLTAALEQLAHEAAHHHHDHDCDCGCHEHEHHHHDHDCDCGCHEHEHEHHHHDHDCDCGCHEHEHEHAHHHHDHDCDCGCHEHEHAHHHHDHDCDCGCHEHEHHHHHHADEVFVSWGMETARIFSRASLSAMLDALAEEERFGQVLRAKGMVDGGEEGWLFFDYVPGEQEIRSGKPAATGRLCVIGAKLNEEELAKVFAMA